MILIDANIFMYAAGRESPQRLPCQRFLDRIVGGGGPAVCTDAEVLQEILHRYRSLKLPEVAFQVFDAVTPQKEVPAEQWKKFKRGPSRS